MLINTTEYVPFAVAVRLFGKTQMSLIFRAKNGSVRALYIPEWNKTLYNVSDIERVKNLRKSRY